MEILTIKETLPLTIKLTGKEDNELTYKINEAILEEVNERLGINAQSVLKLLLNGLKKPNNDNTDIVRYVRKGTIWVIEHRRKDIYKPIGKFVNIIEYYNNFRDVGYKLSRLDEKYFEYLCYHVAYENPFVKVNDLELLHRKCLDNKTFEAYLKDFEEYLRLHNVPLPKEALIDKANRSLKEWDEILKKLED